MWLPAELVLKGLRKTTTGHVARCPPQLAVARWKVLSGWHRGVRPGLRGAPMARLLLGTMLPMLLGACGGGAAQQVSTGLVPLTPDQLGCSRPTGLVTYPGPGQDKGYPGAHAGPLWWVMASGQRELVVPDYFAGKPTKFPIELSTRVSTMIVLKGWSCATSEHLRFCYHPGCQSEIPDLGGGRIYSTVDMKSLGDDPAVLPVREATGDYVGDLLFWAPGMYRVSAYQEDRLLGSVVFGVPAPK